jgi:spore germination protein YaaH
MKRFSSLFLALVVAGALMVPVSTPTAASALTVKQHDQSHPLVMQWAADLANAPATPSSSAPAKASVQLTSFRSTALVPNTRLQREVFGFVNAGNFNSSSVGWTTWNLSLLSTVAFFGLQVNSGDGNLVQTGTGWTVYHSQAMLDFVSAAHAAGTRVIVSINLHDFSASPTNQVCKGLIAANAQNTITQSVQQITAAGIDGINIDYEGTNTTCSNGLTSREQFTTFMQNLRAAMPQGSYLAVDTYSGSAEDNLEFFDISGIGPSVDSFFVMAYDMDYSNSTEAPLNCASYCFNPISPLSTYRFNTSKSMAQYKALVPASKIVLGQPYYGRRGCVANLTTAHQLPTPNTNFVAPTYIFASTVATQTGVFNFAAHRDPNEGVAEWDTWYDSDWACNREQYLDDVTSLAAKYDLVNADDLRGVGLFTLDYGGGSPELWNLLAAKFTTTTPWTSLGGVLTSSPDASAWGASRIDAFARGQDNGLWQNTWNGTAWAGWAPLGGVATSDPGAVSWGSNRIDVFIRGSDNALWHRYSDGTQWSGWESLGGSFTSGPDVTSWGPSRLDIFMRGKDNALWHKAWTGTAWGAWESLGGALSANPTAVAWGPNRLDIFVRGTDNQMWHKAWLANHWGPWEPLGGRFISGPDAASCASNRLDVFAVGNDHGLWRQSWTGSAWTAWQPLGGRWTSDPSAVCPPGTTTLSLFDRGIDYAVWTTSMPGTT